MPQALATGVTSAIRPMQPATNAAVFGPIADVSPQQFVQKNRIHIRNGSVFVDPYLVIHPRELDPKNEAALRQKLRLTYGINNPSFFEAPERNAIAVNLGQLIPVSLSAERSKLMDAVQQFNTQVDAGGDPQVAQKIKDKHAPFAAIVRSTIENPKTDPVGMEVLANGLGMYLLFREKLTQQKFYGRLTDYVERSATADQVLSDLADELGVTPLQVREAAAKGGLEGVGKLLGIEPAYVADVKKLTTYAATHEFGYNLVEHWHLGRQLLGIGAPLEQKIATGMEARINAKITEYRGRVRGFYDVPEPIQAEEKRVAQALELVEPIQRALMDKLGYEICYSPEMTADDIALHRGIYGLHRKAANDQRDIAGTYRIYFAGKGDLKGSMRTLVHEITHNLWPEQFSASEVQQIDALAESDRVRFEKLKRVMDEKFPEFEKLLKAYQAGNDAEKAAVAAKAAEYFAPYGVRMDEGLLPYVRDAHDFKYLVQYAHETLSVEGSRYQRSGYASVPEQFREVLSRFAELKQVELRGEPQLLHFLAPGLDQIYEAHYLPHLERVYHKAVAYEQGHVSTIAHRDEAANEPVMETVVQPKVENRPAPVAACVADGAPLSTVDAGTILHTDRTQAAANALQALR